MGAHALTLLRGYFSGLEVAPVDWVRVTERRHPAPDEVVGQTTAGTWFRHDGYEPIILAENDLYSRFQFGEGGGVPRHMWSGEAPAEGELICGDPVGPAGSKRLRSWFKADDRVLKFIDVILNGTSLSERELATHFIGSDDHYWALLRLVLFDNLEVFSWLQHEGTIKPRDMEPGDEVLAHPAFGTEYFHSGDFGLSVNWHGMKLPTTVSEYVHTLSWRLETPGWWEAYKTLLGSDLIACVPHPVNGRVCRACLAENPNASDDGWPYR